MKTRKIKKIRTPKAPKEPVEIISRETFLEDIVSDVERLFPTSGPSPEILEGAMMEVE